MEERNLIGVRDRKGREVFQGRETAGRVQGNERNKLGNGRKDREGKREL